MEEEPMRRAFTAAFLWGALFTGGAAAAADRTVTLSVDNMYCAACPYIVKQSLAAVSGVEKVEVSFEKKTATVTFDDQKASLNALTKATTQAGYPSRMAAQ
jgi:periplasmic mercuric ion binding protein